MEEQLEQKLETKSRVVRIGGLLKEIITIRDGTGAILSKVVSPLRIEFHGKDVMQIIIGSMILAVPVGFTEEVWVLSETLPRNNVIGIVLISIMFLSMFVYYNYYRGVLGQNKADFIKRTLATYVFSLIVVGIFLTVIGKAAWFIDWTISINRIVLVALPASMSAAVADMIK
jgi:uncharacterized membrane protein